MSSVGQLIVDTMGLPGLSTKVSVVTSCVSDTYRKTEEECLIY